MPLFKSCVVNHTGYNFDPTCFLVRYSLHHIWSKKHPSTDETNRWMRMDTKTIWHLHQTYGQSRRWKRSRIDHEVYFPTAKPSVVGGDWSRRIAFGKHAWQISSRTFRKIHGHPWHLPGGDVMVQVKFLRWYESILPYHGLGVRKFIHVQLYWCSLQNHAITADEDIFVLLVCQTTVTSRNWTLPEASSISWPRLFFRQRA